jgi:RNA polymerase sigma-70 factor (ECF subfamily)
MAPGAKARAEGGDGRDGGDRQLLAQVAAGRRAAFEALYRVYFPRLERFLGSLSRERSLMEEVINDTMYVVWRKAASFDGSCKVSTWIFAIAFRTAKKAFCKLDPPEESELEDIEDDGAGAPDRLCELHELRGAVAAALAALPAMQRAVVSLTYLHHLDYGEIAQILDCPVNTVKTRMFHARRQLRVLLGELREDER